MSAHITSFTEQLIGTVLKDMFHRYRGKTIMETKEGFCVYGTLYPTIEEAKKRVDETFPYLTNSIK